MAIALENINRQLAAIERDPLPVGVQQGDGKRVAVGGDAEFIEKPYSSWVRDARVARVNRQFGGSTIGKKIKEQLFRLERQEIALMYRANVDEPLYSADLQEVPRAFTEQDKADLERDLSVILIRYKQNQDLYPGRHGELTPQDLVQIHEVCQNFPFFAHTLRERNRGDRNDEIWTTGFVKFCLRSPGLSLADAHHWVKIFVEFPNEVDALMSSNLDKRLGVRPALLNIVIQGGLNVLCMKVNGEDVRIQGTKDTIVALPNRVNRNAPDYRVPVRQIFDEMKAKRAGYGPFEVTHIGVENFNTILQGSTRLVLGPDGNPVLDQNGRPQTTVDEIQVVQMQQNPDGTPVLDARGLPQPILDEHGIPRPRAGWMYDIPALCVVSEAELRARYPGQMLWPENTPHEERIAVAACANREEATLHMVNTHGFFKLFLPEPDRPGYSRIISAGFQPPKLPGNTLEKAEMMLKTQEARLHLLDEGFFRTDRDQWEEVYPLTPGSFAAGEAHLSHFVTESRAGMKTFQMTGNNCAKRTQDALNVFLGTLFLEPFERLATEIFPGQNVNGELKKIMEHLDEHALTRLATQLGDRLVETHDHARMATLLSLCMKALSQTLKVRDPVQEFDLPVERARERIDALYAGHPEQADGILRTDLAELIKLAIGSQQFYKLPFFNAEFHENPVLAGFFNFIRATALDWWVKLPSSVEWLSQLPRLLLYYLFTCIVLLPIAAWRPYIYQERDGSWRAESVMTNPLTGRMIHLPAQAFNRPELKAQWSEQARAILARLEPQQREQIVNREPFVNPVEIPAPQQLVEAYA